MRVAIRVLALSFLASAALATPAAAQLAPRIGDRPYRALSGPVFAGDALVAGHRTRTGYEVLTTRGAQRTATTVEIPGFDAAGERSVSGHLEASADRVVLGLVASVCPTGKRCIYPKGLVYGAVLTGPVGGDLSVIAGCTTAQGCRPDPGPVVGAPDVSEDAVAYTDCDGVHVRDFAPAASPPGRDFAGPRSETRIAGPYVVRRKDADSLAVSNWRTGADVYSVASDPDFAGPRDVQDDGKIVFAEYGGIYWASPAEPVAHEVIDGYYGIYGLRIASDRIAGEFHNPAYDEYTPAYGLRFDVLGLDGPSDPEWSPRQEDEWALGGLDFDGTRLMWAARGCRHAWARTWDPDTGIDTVSGDLPDACPAPDVVPGSARVDREHRLSLRLECDVPAGPACEGAVRRIGRQGKLLLPTNYSIAEQHAKTLRLHAHGSLCRTGPRHARARLVITQGFVDIYLAPAEGPSEDVKLTVSARGPTAGLPSC